ncbi:hypothetical protein BY996DRAFT_4037471 [Phakopsora pachyrhizi]|nr:hypothetical protein BY996DRAFT_4037471 [Phakopsora pachyrhizi]
MIKNRGGDDYDYRGSENDESGMEGQISPETTLAPGTIFDRSIFTSSTTATPPTLPPTTAPNHSTSTLASTSARSDCQISDRTDQSLRREGTDLEKRDEPLSFQQTGKDNMRTFRFPIERHHTKPENFELRHDSSIEPNQFAVGHPESIIIDQGSSRNSFDPDMTRGDPLLLGSVLPRTQQFGVRTEVDQEEEEEEGGGGFGSVDEKFLPAPSIDSKNLITPPRVTPASPVDEISEPREVGTSLRQRSSFDDDTSEDELDENDEDELAEGDDEEEGVIDERRNRFKKQLIKKTRPKNDRFSSSSFSSSVLSSDIEEERGIDDGRSIVSLSQLQQQKKEWELSGLATDDQDFTRNAQLGDNEGIKESGSRCKQLKALLMIPVKISSEKNTEEDEECQEGIEEVRTPMSQITNRSSLFDDHENRKGNVALDRLSEGNNFNDEDDIIPELIIPGQSNLTMVLSAISTKKNQSNPSASYLLTPSGGIGSEGGG